ncbi:hypothetical protein [Nocardioides daphniae]|uniref:hypothetical protein n=1 Tax=Nocardioides daphniae TaxID=402297 RepID=UPI001315A09C|nr:hypothetical protein [Nocardioides daphniae]
MRTNIFRRAVVAGASAAVALVGLGTVTSTAQAADVSLKFNCSVSILTGEEFGFDAAVEVPATAEQGKPLTLSFDGTVSASNTVRQSAYYILNARALSGTADIDAKFGGQDLPLVAQVARTEVPGGTEVQPLVLPAKGSATFTPTAVGTQTVTIAGFKANLKSEKSDGTTADVEATCVAKDAAAAVATVEVTKSTAPAKVATKATAQATPRRRRRPRSTSRS